jgi:hypothetical protein
MSITIVLKPHENPRIDPLTDAERLRWVLEFIWRDLAALPAEELVTLGDDLVHAVAPWWVQEKRQCTEMSGAEVLALQQEIHEGVNKATGTSIDVREMMMISSGHAHPHGGWVLPQAAMHLVRLRQRFREGDYLCIMCVSECTNNQMAIRTGVVNLLLKFGERLLTCPVCGTLFLREYRQAYCTVKCSNKVRNKRRLDRKSHRRGIASSTDTASLTTV